MILLLVILIPFVIITDECFCNLVIQLFPIATVLVNDKAVPVLVCRRGNSFLRRRRHLIICPGMCIRILIVRYTGNLQFGRSVNLTVCTVLELLGYIDSGTFDVCNRFRNPFIIVRKFIHCPEHACRKIEVPNSICRSNSCPIIRQVYSISVPVKLYGSIKTVGTILPSFRKITDSFFPFTLIQGHYLILERCPLILCCLIIILDLELNGRLAIIRIPILFNRQRS